MTKFYTKGATRMYSWNLVEAWAEAEENLGLESSEFYMDNGTVTQWVDADEAEEFYNDVIKWLQIENWFDELCGDYFKAIKSGNKIRMFECLAIFNEMDEHPEIANEDQLRRLKRVRESTHEEIYK